MKTFTLFTILSIAAAAGQSVDMQASEDVMQPERLLREQSWFFGGKKLSAAEIAALAGDSVSDIDEDDIMSTLQKYSQMVELSPEEQEQIAKKYSEDSWDSEVTAEFAEIWNFVKNGALPTPSVAPTEEQPQDVNSETPIAAAPTSEDAPVAAPVNGSDTNVTTTVPADTNAYGSTKAEVNAVNATEAYPTKGESLAGMNSIPSKSSKCREHKPQH